MTDLISRADAIEHLKNVKVSYPHADISLPIDLAIKAIEILPSAEAEPKENHAQATGAKHVIKSLGTDSISHNGIDCTDFINWLTEEVMDEEMWELNAVANGEIICRKLVKLGVLEITEEPSYYIRPSADAVSRDVYDKRTKADEEIIDSYREKLANCHKEILRLLDFNDIMESPNDAIKRQNDVIEVVRCKDCKHYIVEGIATQYGWCHEYKHSVDEDDYCSYGEREK